MTRRPAVGLHRAVGLGQAVGLRQAVTPPCAAPRRQAAPRRGAAAAGFGMLEAVVALALFALVGSTLFAWIDTNLATAVRLRDRDRALHDLQLASAWVQTIDPMQAAGGEAEPEPGTRLRWQAHALTPVTPVAPLPGGTRTPFRLALYEVEVTVVRSGGGEQRFSLRRVGVERDAVQETLR